MRRNLLTRLALFAMLFVSFVMVPVACSSDDGGTGTEQQPDPDPDPDPEPTPEADPTNANTTLNATAAAHSNGVSTSTVTIKLADADGKLLKASGGTVVLSVTGSATVSEVTDNENGTYTATVSSETEETVTVSAKLDGVDITSTVDITFNPDESNPAQEVAQSTEPLGPTLLRINCGGPEATYEGHLFLADQYFDGPTEAYTNPLFTEEDTDMNAIFLTERISDNTGGKGPFSYRIPVTNGTYTVKLYFAEIYWGVDNPEGLEGGVGSRIFNVTMEDTEIFTGYDLYKEHGAGKPGTRMYDIEVTDGELTITFKASVNKPKVSAIEVLGTGSVEP
ncbi:malectin domain-containing carbohydrate-binding protein [Zobellia uliginosa]|uniref:malectin domain-containing carbohydrate-binding protein n=1 Tax=Zobellia uliginosa TaxID=143224 RepID=UPI0026E144D5|nr:malectin domain-containing carbohydrate-binding protein [Zobellia uliginosa]MDO6519700.1 malectin domain-containing carbohydrate-binding protein [Zobellia uliginosa]